jgi:hypothetical protein
MIHKFKLPLCLLIAATFLFTSCDQSSVTSSPDESTSPGNVLSKNNKKANGGENTGGMEQGTINAYLQAVNDTLAQRGLQVRLSYAETVTQKGNAEQATGQTLFANDRTKRLTSQWVPGDQRRLADGNNLTYLVFQPFSLANGSVDSEPAIDASMDTWESVKKNQKLDIVKRPYNGPNPSAILGTGSPFAADITEIGFLPGFIFDAILGPGSSDGTLGVTFTFNFIDADGNPTDINNDGFADTALKEVWYNDNFLWTTNANAPGTDIETVALHENGHALGFGHFGKIFITNNNNKLHVAPRAVMNAIILGALRDPLGTDNASFSSVYGNWPKN